MISAKIHLLNHAIQNCIYSILLCNYAMPTCNYGELHLLLMEVVTEEVSVPQTNQLIHQVSERNTMLFRNRNLKCVKRGHTHFFAWPSQ